MSLSTKISKTNETNETYERYETGLFIFRRDLRMVDNTGLN